MLTSCAECPLLFIDADTVSHLTRHIEGIWYLDGQRSLFTDHVVRSPG